MFSSRKKYLYPMMNHTGQTSMSKTLFLIFYLPCMVLLMLKNGITHIKTYKDKTSYWYVFNALYGSKNIMLINLLKARRQGRLYG
jgi:hypothetical protein